MQSSMWRALRDDAYIRAMRRSERLSEILAILATDGAVDVASLAGRLGVSEATARRDLQLLEEQRMLARTHGGAIANDVMYELPLRYKAARRHPEKIRIAREAAGRVGRRRGRRAHGRHDDDRDRARDARPNRPHRGRRMRSTSRVSSRCDPT